MADVSEALAQTMTQHAIRSADAALETLDAVLRTGGMRLVPVAVAEEPRVIAGDRQYINIMLGGMWFTVVET